MRSLKFTFFATFLIINSGFSVARAEVEDSLSLLINNPVDYAAGFVFDVVPGYISTQALLTHLLISPHIAIPMHMMNMATGVEFAISQIITGHEPRLPQYNLISFLSSQINSHASLGNLYHYMRGEYNELAFQRGKNDLQWLAAMASSLYSVKAFWHFWRSLGKIVGHTAVPKETTEITAPPPTQELLRTITTVQQEPPAPPTTPVVSVFSIEGTRYAKKYPEGSSPDDRFREDRYVSTTLDNSIRYCAVYDGHNGPKVAELLANEFHLYLHENREAWQKDPIALQNLFAQFDQRCCQIQGGSTVTIMIDDPNSENLLFAVVGDSPLMIVNEDRETVLRSQDHHPIGEEKNRIERNGGKVQGNRVVQRTQQPSEDKKPIASLGLSRAMGDIQFKRTGALQFNDVIPSPDIYTVRRQDVTFVVLMSDGVEEACHSSEMDNLPQEIQKLVARGVSNVAQQFIEGLPKKGSDDITLMVIH